MPQRYSHTTKLPRIELLRPELGLWGGLLLLMCSMFMTSTKFSANLPVVQLPSCSNSCSSLPPTQFIFSLDAQKRLYMHASTAELQTKAIELLAQRYGLQLSAEQLQQLPYLSSDVRQLPSWLAIPSWARKPLSGGISYSTPNNQLTALLQVANRAAYAIHGHRAIVCLRLDAKLPAAVIMPLFQQIQAQGFNHLVLITESE